MTSSAGLRPVIDDRWKPGREQVDYTPARAELRASWSRSRRAAKASESQERIS